MPRFNLLHLPQCSRLFRWRWGRLVFQIGLLLIAALMLYDGFTGPPFPPENIATVVTWVHYRGIIVFGFLLLGNIFCMDLPFTTPLAHLRKNGRCKAEDYQPYRATNGWPLACSSSLFLFLYKMTQHGKLDLWASPWLTAWIILAYFVFPALCWRWVFTPSAPSANTFVHWARSNYVSSTISPCKLAWPTATSAKLVRSRVLNVTLFRPVYPSPVARRQRFGGWMIFRCWAVVRSYFRPQMQSNLDCTLCLDCACACRTKMSCRS